MSISGERVLLRVYLESADRAPHTPTYERLVKAARNQRLAGATVLKGILGYGSHGFIRPSSSIWSLVEHVPVIVEIVDSAERIGAFVNGTLGGLMIHGMATLERAFVMMYRHSGSEGRPHLELGGAHAPLSTIPEIEAREPMQIRENGVLLRVFIGESDRYQHRPLYEAIVQKARELGLSGATVLRGTEGYGANSVVHKSSLLEMSTDLPLVIEIVDTEDRIRLLLPHLETMVRDGMITMEHVAIVLYRHDPGDSPPSADPTAL
mgnify:CR=1 FL=1